MEYNLNNKIVERKTKTIYEDNGKTIKLFVENYSKADTVILRLKFKRICSYKRKCVCTVDKYFFSLI